MGTNLAKRVAQLEAMKQSYGPGCAAQGEGLLGSLSGARFRDAELLIRFHDALLFLRAFPQSEKIVELSEGLLSGAEAEVRRLRDSGTELSEFDDEAVSGIAGATITNAWTYELARRLKQRHGPRIRAEWNVEEQYRHLATILPEVMPLMADDSSVEADTPYREWIGTAAGGAERDLEWLQRSFQALPVSPSQRTSLYDALGIELVWDLGGSPASRTYARRCVPRFFYHDAPLLQRKQVSLAGEMAGTPLPLRQLSLAEAQSVIDMARDALAVRYRELHGSTHGDPAHAFTADVGRGVQLFIWGLDRDWRLPLRAYYAGFTLKNGVPVNYFEAIGLFDWMEVGFNTFYAFREGETAWIYSKVLHLLHQVAGANCISVYPYQIGKDNEEAIQSGAFWFYRKLGFRPGRPELQRLAELEEARIASNPGYRTSARTLRRLSDGHMFFEFGAAQRGRWDDFSVRHLGLRVQQEMAGSFGGDSAKMSRAAVAWLGKALGVPPDAGSPREQQAFRDFAVALRLTPSVRKWSAKQKEALVAIIRAKAGRDETRYLRLMQRHEALRETLLRLGAKRRTD